MRLFKEKKLIVYTLCTIVNAHSDQTRCPSQAEPWQSGLGNVRGTMDTDVVKSNHPSTPTGHPSLRRFFIAFVRLILSISCSGFGPSNWAFMKKAVHLAHG